MPQLKQFLSSADVGVRHHGDELHIGVAFAEALATALKMFELVPMTTTAFGITAIGGFTVGSAILAGATPVLGLAASFMALGSGYEQAREEIQNEASASGFARGFTCGLLRMTPTSVKSLFGQHGVIPRHAMDPEADRLEMTAYNRGLVAGYAMGSYPSDDDKKAYLLEIKPHTGNLGGGAWGDREKKDYVLTYGAKLRLHFLEQ